MSKEQFQECLEKMDMKTFNENPKQAMINAGITLKEGITFKLVEDDAEANALPKNVFPLKRVQKNTESLSMENLDKVAGGTDVNLKVEGLDTTKPFEFIFNK